MSGHSSKRKGCEMMKARTQRAQREPPYARDTFFCRLLMRLYSLGRNAGICRDESEHERGVSTAIARLDLLASPSLRGRG